ncbi:MAG: hypothetical protein H6R40_691 [Gemmatimonadetes bacterium]|nr:hypothetical protein [Gemmatimonadota bacterium]
MDGPPGPDDLLMVKNDPITEPAPARRPLSLTLPRPRRSAWSLVASLLLHLALVGALVLARWRGLLSWQEIPPPGSEEAGRARGGGGGGGGIIMVALPAYQAPQPATPVPPPAPVPPPEPVLAQPQPQPAPPPQAVPTTSQDSTAVAASAGLGGPGSGGGSGTGVGTGRGAGTGPGSGGGTGGGEGAGSGKARPPEPRQLILPPLDYPEGMRGRTVAVTFWVNTDGAVERVAVAPEIGDRGFERKLIAVMRNYRFRPARSAEGMPIPATITISVTF